MALAIVADLASSLCAVVIAPLPCGTIHPRHNNNSPIDCALPWSHYFNLSAVQDGSPIVFTAREYGRVSTESEAPGTVIESRRECSNNAKNPLARERSASQIIVDGYQSAERAIAKGEQFVWTIDICSGAFDWGAFNSLHTRTAAAARSCTHVHLSTSNTVRRAADAVLAAIGATAVDGFGLVHIRRTDMANFCSDGRGSMTAADVPRALSCMRVPSVTHPEDRATAETQQHELRARDMFVAWMRTQASPQMLIFEEEGGAFLGEVVAGIGRASGWRARVVHADAVATRVLGGQVHRADSTCADCRDFQLLPAVMQHLKNTAAANIRFGYGGICPASLALGCERTGRGMAPG